MTIDPDTKNWTWVLERPCDECGVDPAAIDPRQVGALTRAGAERWAELLAGPDVATRTRPDRWSTLEYACHVRDVYRVMQVRASRMLSEDGPQFANWDQDETAIIDRYDEQDPTVVARELVDAAAVVAATFDSVTDDQWSRTGFRSDGAAFTVESLARYFVHDPAHHLWDLGISDPLG